MSNTEFRSTNAAGKFCALLLLVCLGLAAPSFLTFAAPEDAPPTNAVPANTNSIELLRPYLQLQEQLRALQLSIEENRKEADAAAGRNAQSVAGRLQDLERTLAIERARDLDAVRSSNRLMLIISVAFAVVGLLAASLMAYQWRTVGRLAELSANRPPLRELGPPRAALEAGEPQLLGAGLAEQSSSRLLDALNRIEQRIHDLEQTSHPPLNPAPPASNHSETAPTQAESNSEPAAVEDSADTGEGSRLGLLLGKGQSLLNLDQPEEALKCFNQALALEPAHTDALMKKAVALERLRKLPEAIECYDRAIAADESLTIAYLYKGGLLNRMERFGEALECYEQALRTQEKS